MYDYLIGQFVERMTDDDIDRFAKQNGITLTKEEICIFSTYIKRDWRTLVHGNPRKIFDEVESKLEPATYQKMIELYRYFKEKYQNYL